MEKQILSVEDARRRESEKDLVIKRNFGRSCIRTTFKLIITREILKIVTGRATIKIMQLNGRIILLGERTEENMISKLNVGNINSDRGWKC